MADWVVHLLKLPNGNEYKTNYFPRRFHYKADAKRLSDEIERKGGKCRLERVLLNRKSS